SFFLQNMPFFDIRRTKICPVIIIVEKIVESCIGKENSVGSIGCYLRNQEIIVGKNDIKTLVQFGFIHRAAFFVYGFVESHKVALAGNPVVVIALNPA